MKLTWDESPCSPINDAHFVYSKNGIAQLFINFKGESKDYLCCGSYSISKNALDYGLTYWFHEESSDNDFVTVIAEDEADIQILRRVSFRRREKNQLWIIFIYDGSLGIVQGQ